MRRTRDWGILAFHAVLAAISALAAFQLRFDFQIPQERWNYLPVYILISLTVKVVVYQLTGLNRGWWKYFSLSDMVQIFKAVTIAHALIFAIHLLPFAPFIPRATTIIDYTFTLLLVGGARMGMRLYYERLHLPFASRRSSDKRVLIIGAGDCGIHLLRQIQTSESERIQVIGFLDDSRQKKEMRFLGVPVLGQVKILPELVAQHRISEIYIAIPSLRKEPLKRIVDLCLQAGVTFKTVPSLQDILRDGMKLNELREVQVEDLLGREPIKLDKQIVRESLRDKVVMVTGAGGSIGSELCRQILQLTPRKLILFERSEYNLFTIERELRGKSSDVIIIPIVGDMTDVPGTREIFQNHRPHIVYHAAAHKHVHLMEVSPREAVRNNVAGTRNLAKIAFEFEVEDFVMISTDKAVRPLSIMGYSKRLAELIVQHFGQKASGKRTKFISVRFGNVLGSSGSVVEVFRSQLSKNEPLTVTDPEATRFFMTMPEAVELVLHAGAHGANSEIYMLDMGQPVKIMDLARRMIQLTDPTGRRDFQIQITGLRQGEKLFEELYWEGENAVPSNVEKVFRLKTKVPTLGIEDYVAYLEKCLAEPSSDMSIAQELKACVENFDRQVRADKAAPATAEAPLQIARFQ